MNQTEMILLIAQQYTRDSRELNDFVKGRRSRDYRPFGRKEK